MLFRVLLLPEKFPEANPLNRAQTLHSLATLYSGERQYEEAEALFLRALEIKQATWGDDHPVLGNTLENLARLYQNRQLYEKAEQFFRRAVDVLERGIGPAHPSLAPYLEHYAELLRVCGRSDECAKLEGRARRIRARSPKVTHQADTLH